MVNPDGVTISESGINAISNPTIRENLYKTYAAALCTELVIKTKCAGSIDKSWTLLNGFLDGLELCKEKNQCTAGLIRFLWRYIDLMGIKPDSSRCSHCGQIFFTSKNLTDTVSYTSEGAVFNPQENSFICQSCTNEKVPFFLKNELKSSFKLRSLFAVSLCGFGSIK